MAYPIYSFSTKLAELDRGLLWFHDFLVSTQTRMASDDVPSSLLFDLHRRCRENQANLLAARDYASAEPSFVNYVQEQKNQPALDVIGELTATYQASKACGDQVEQDFPQDAEGFLLAQTWGANGPTDRAFSPAQTAGVRAAIQAILDTLYIAA